MSEAKKLIPKEEAVRLSLKWGDHVANCKCSESLMMGFGLCPWCRDQALRDCNFVTNTLAMSEDK